MVKKPTLHSLGLPCAVCARVFMRACVCLFASNCVQVGVCVCFTDSLEGNHKAALSLTLSRHVHYNKTKD